MARVKREFEFSESILEVAEERTKQEGYPDVNSYLVALIRLDALNSLTIKDRLDVEGFASQVITKGGN